MKCQHRGRIYDKPYCTSKGGDCDALRWLWCKGIVLYIFMAVSIGWFAYGIVFAWQYADDRVEVQQKIEKARSEAKERMDEMERRLNENERTIVSKWKRDAKKKKEAKKSDLPLY